MIVDLTGKTALVCGSSQGIGRAIAHEFAASGANVVLMARNEERLQTVLKSLKVVDGARHRIVVADFSDPMQVEERLKEHLSENPEIHILVNNTGGPPGGRAIDAELEAYLAAFNSHLICNQIISKLVVPFMESSGYGRILNVISTSVKQPLSNLGVSNTIRGAVASWSKTLASELASSGITVNNLLPGATETERLDTIVGNKVKTSGESLETVRASMVNAIPAKRFGKPEEIAYVATFLASDLAGYINGTNVVVDGGRTSSL